MAIEIGVSHPLKLKNGQTSIAGDWTITADSCRWEYYQNNKLQFNSDTATRQITDKVLPSIDHPLITNVSASLDSKTLTVEFFPYKVVILPDPHLGFWTIHEHKTKSSLFLNNKGILSREIDT